MRHGASDALFNANTYILPSTVLDMYEAMIDEELQSTVLIATGDAVFDAQAKQCEEDIARFNKEMHDAAKIARMLLILDDGIEQMCDHENDYVRSIGLALRDEYYRDLAI